MTNCFTAAVTAILLGKCCPHRPSFISLNRWSEGVKSAHYSRCVRTVQPRLAVYSTVCKMVPGLALPCCKRKVVFFSGLTVKVIDLPLTLWSNIKNKKIKKGSITFGALFFFFFCFLYVCVNFWYQQYVKLSWNSIWSASDVLFFLCCCCTLLMKSNIPNSFLNWLVWETALFGEEKESQVLISAYTVSCPWDLGELSSHSEGAVF